MGFAPLLVEIVLTFFLTAAILYRYGNWWKHHIVVTLSVLIAWYFSLLIVFLLPLDLSNTIYETCLAQNTNTSQLHLRQERSVQTPLDHLTATVLPFVTTVPGSGVGDPFVPSQTQQPQTQSVGKVQDSSVDGTPLNKSLSGKTKQQDTLSEGQPLKPPQPAEVKSQAVISEGSQPENPLANVAKLQDSDIIIAAAFNSSDVVQPIDADDDLTMTSIGVNSKDEDILNAVVTEMMKTNKKAVQNSGSIDESLAGNKSGSNIPPLSADANVKPAGSQPQQVPQLTTSPPNNNINTSPSAPLDPKDMSNTVVSQKTTTIGNKIDDQTDTMDANTEDHNTTEDPVCKKPRSYVPQGVFSSIWRVVYWTSQLLTWLILPLMQSYTKAGEFTVWGKLRSAMIDNAIYYGSFLLIVIVLLLYIVISPNIHLNSSQLRAIAASASNTWGLFWLVLLLGYGLVEVPRGLWQAASPHLLLNQGYFRAAKLAHERSEAWTHLNDLLKSVRSIGTAIGSIHPLRDQYLTVEARIPPELLDRLPSDAGVGSGQHGDVPSEKALVRLHKQLLKALQHHHRVETQWTEKVESVLFLEDVQRNSCSQDTRFKHTLPHQRHRLTNLLYTPWLEWQWQCRVRRGALRCVGVCAALVSVAVVWSELTFFNKAPTLSIFALIVNAAKADYNYFAIEVISTLTMAYIALCAYSTLFAVRVLNLYYLAPHHQTDQYSLIFAGMMLCRLTPPMCLNFLSVIHMDSHIIDIQSQETHYTQVMGHMDVIGIISDGFNVYFPMAIVALCLATYFSLGSRLLSALGFQQFVGADPLTSDLVDEGRALISRECRKQQRQHDSAERKRDFAQRYGGPGDTASTLYRSARERAARLLHRPPRPSSAHMELLTPGPGEQQGSYGGWNDSPPGGTTFYSSSAYLDEPDLPGYHGNDEVFHGNDDARYHGNASPSRATPDRGLFDDI